MSIKSELHCIQSELDAIAESSGRVKMYAIELNKLNPFKVGSTLKGNGHTHSGKEFIVDTLIVSDWSGSKDLRYRDCQGTEAIYFAASGYILKRDGSLGAYRTTYAVLVSEYLKNTGVNKIG